MIIENREYIKLNIKENLYFYFLIDKNLKFNKEIMIKLENKIYFKFLEYLSINYKLEKIIDINNIKEEFIYFEINENKILLDIIENNIY